MTLVQPDECVKLKWCHATGAPCRCRRPVCAVSHRRRFVTSQRGSTVMLKIVQELLMFNNTRNFFEQMFSCFWRLCVQLFFTSADVILLLQQVPKNSQHMSFIHRLCYLSLTFYFSILLTAGSSHKLFCVLVASPWLCCRCRRRNVHGFMGSEIASKLKIWEDRCLIVLREIDL